MILFSTREKKTETGDLCATWEKWPGRNVDKLRFHTSGPNRPQTIPAKSTSFPEPYKYIKCLINIKFIEISTEIGST